MNTPTSTSTVSTENSGLNTVTTNNTDDSNLPGSGPAIGSSSNVASSSTDPNVSKDQFEDLASLFLPDTLQPLQNSSSHTNIKQEDIDSMAVGNADNAFNSPGNYGNFNFSLSQSPMIQDNFSVSTSAMNQYIQQHTQNQNPNQQQIQHQQLQNQHQQNQSQQLQQQLQQLQQLQFSYNKPNTGYNGQQIFHVNHYANYIPLEAQPTLNHAKLHMSMYQVNHCFDIGQGNNQIFPPGTGQTPGNSATSLFGNSNYPPRSGYDMNWAFEYEANGVGMSAEQQQQQQQQYSNQGLQNQVSSQLVGGNASNISNENHPKQATPQAGAPAPTETAGEGATKTKGKKYQRAKKIRLKTPSTLIDYKLSKLTTLLDLIPSSDKASRSNLNSEHKIVDKNNQEIDLRLSGFLNGKFFTNDFDNNNYISISQEDVNLNKQSKADPKIISCYRRNFIQLSINLNLKNFSCVDSKVLNLQTTEFGYIITRVIKWFKLEISARTVSTQSKYVPIIITDDSAEKKDSGLKLEENNDDFIYPESIGTATYIIPLNKEEINDQTLSIDNYYSIKKLQFKNATPHNGNFTFQNYYHLRVKLSAVVADMYYDDYIDNDRSNFQEAGNTDETGDAEGNDDKNEIVLSELVSKPIIVRGRNPSFYSDRKDVLIKGRSSNLKKSYKELLELHAERKDEEEKEEAGGIVDAVDTKEDGIGNEEDEEDEEGDEEDEEEDEDSESNKRRSVTPTIPQPYSIQSYRDNKLIPPLIYSATSSKSINLKSMLNTSRGNNIVNNNVKNMNFRLQVNDQPNSKYKYFPILNVYYLPPINVVYFPHRAHQDKLQHPGGISDGSSRDEAEDGADNDDDSDKHTTAIVTPGSDAASSSKPRSRGSSIALNPIEELKRQERRRSSNVYFK